MGRSSGGTILSSPTSGLRRAFDILLGIEFTTIRNLPFVIIICGHLDIVIRPTYKCTIIQTGYQNLFNTN